MRQTLALVVVLLVVLAARCQPPHGVAEAADGVEPLVGRWSGDWTASAPEGRGRLQGQCADERGALSASHGGVTRGRGR